MPFRSRLLGFAFANADVLFEMERDGNIVFASGAESEMGRGNPLMGQNTVALFEPRDSVKLVSTARSLSPGNRAGPLGVKLIGGREVTIAMCRIPENGERISCTLSYGGKRKPGLIVATDDQTGLPDRDSFVLQAAASGNDTDQLAIVEVSGVEDLAPAEAGSILARIGAAIRQSGFRAAGRISPTGFGAVTQRGVKLAQIVCKALEEGGLANLAIEQTLVSLKSSGLTSEQRMLALRYAVDSLPGKAKGLQHPGDLTRAFENMVRETEARALKLNATVADGSFTLGYQPVVNLGNGRISHYEALSRVEGENTGEMIQFAEALRISDAFDVAVAVKVLGLVEKLGDRSPHVALNLSGHTLATPSSFGLLVGVLARHRKIATRVLIEITETATITDLTDAGRAIQSLRSLGYRVGLDDFGAGAASFQYLHAFPVNFVKLDGSLVQKIGQSRRDDLLLKSIVSLCRELGIETIAEFVTDETIFTRVRDMGFDLGQGHYFSAALPDLPPLETAAVKSAQRKGEREEWC